MEQSWMVESYVVKRRDMGDQLSLKDEVLQEADTEEEVEVVVVVADTVVEEGPGRGPDLVLGTGAAGDVAIPEAAASLTTVALAPRVAARAALGAGPGRTPGSLGPTLDLDQDLEVRKRKHRRMEQNDRH